MKTVNKMGGKKTSFGILGTIGVILLGKLKYLLIVFKFLKLHTLVSMFIYLGTYALFFGWKFAIALVYLIFVHEMGHAYAAKRMKLPVGPAIFIPFLGAIIGMKEMPKSAKDEAFVAYMGPFFGLLSFLPAIPLYLYTHEPFWALFIILGGMINLFNLIPITPLDGGRIAAGINTKLWGLGIVLLLVFSIMKLSFLGFVIVILGASQWYKLYKKQKGLHEDQMEVRKIDRLILQLKQESHDIDLVQEMIRAAKQNISNPEINRILYTLNTEIEKMKDHLYFQQLSGVYTLDEDETRQNQTVIDGILSKLEKKCSEYNKEVQTTATYYKTDKKTKAKLFIIYMGLILALSFSYYYGNEILMNHPDIQKVMNR